MLQKRTLIGLFLVLAGLGAFLWLVFGWPYEKGPKPQAGISWSQARWSDLPGWGTDDLSSALAAFHKSCARRLDLPEDRPVTPSSVGGVAGDWAEPCQAALALDGGERDRIRAYFEDGFTPVAVMFDGSYQGLFTGYYEPLIHASRTPDATHNIPLYRRPPELVTVDLGHFRKDLAGRRIAGEVVDGRLRPFASRAEIEPAHWQTVVWNCCGPMIRWMCFSCKFRDLAGHACPMVR
ncbi:hypothetical protein JCM17845_22320 [Iodidimonas gelatinilytica]|uniref:Lytic transglycosylase MltA domain-containing protein n=1 Tax=Iodidimonas gelatinilytica TaxID=1236966 RepID=A0A5A7N3D5_9PROT|nr:hypothetical protein JCM17845_22320 [Iodidimonas gelatinilytica]